MSERLNTTSPEQFNELAEVTPARPKAEHAPAETVAEKLKVARQEVAALASEKALPAMESSVERPHFIDSSTKSLRLTKSMQTVQTRLTGPQKSFSKLIHQPLVQKVSEQAAKTVTRPSGLLGGGVAAFFGSLGYALFTQYYGFTYNFSIFLLLFVGGFAAGVAIEYAAYGLHKLRRQRLLKQAK